MKNRKFNIFSIDSIYQEYQFDYSSISIVKHFEYLLFSCSFSIQLAMCFGNEVPVHPTHLGFVDPNCYVEDTIRG